MKINWNDKYNTIAMYTFLTCVAIALAFTAISRFSLVMGFLSQISEILTPFIYGGVLAYLLNPLMVNIEKKFLPFVFRSKFKPKQKTLRGLAILLTFLLAALVLAVFFMIVIPQVAVSVMGIVNRIPGYVPVVSEALTRLMDQLPDAELLPAALVSKVEDIAKNLLQTIYTGMSRMVPMLFSYTSRVTTSVLNVVVGVIISVYMLADKERFFAQLKKILYALFPKSIVNKTIEIAHQSNRTFIGFISGKILDSTIIGIICFVCMTVFGMPSAMLVSVIVGLTNIIPYFGPFIGAIPSAVIILLDSPMMAFWFLIFILVLQQFDGNILGPKILGNSTGLTAFWVVFSIMIFGGLFGFIGMVIGVPTFSVIYSLFGTFVNYRLRKKSLSTDTADYASEHNPIKK